MALVHCGGTFAMEAVASQTVFDEWVMVYAISGSIDAGSKSLRLGLFQKIK